MVGFVLNLSHEVNYIICFYYFSTSSAPSQVLHITKMPSPFVFVMLFLRPLTFHIQTPNASAYDLIIDVQGEFTSLVIHTASAYGASCPTENMTCVPYGVTKIGCQSLLLGCTADIYFAIEVHTSID